MLDLEFKKRAVCDIRSIQIHYEVNESDVAAKKHIDTILSGIENLIVFPDLGRPVDNPGINSVGYRKYLKDDFWIYYSHNGKKLTVWRIVNSKQAIDDYIFTEF